LWNTARPQQVQNCETPPALNKSKPGRGKRKRKRRRKEEKREKRKTESRKALKNNKTITIIPTPTYMSIKKDAQ